MTPTRLALATALILLGGCSQLETGLGTSSAGPGQGSWSTVQAGGMSTRLYVPSSAIPTEGRGLMVVLHGCAQQNTDIGDSGNWGDTADRAGWVVAAPAAPNGGVLFGCWDYYGSNHSRSSGHSGAVLDLVSDLLGDGALGIAPEKVYVSGLSSGGGESMVLGCLAPDVFAAVGINAGPTVGTGSGDIGRVATSLSAAVSTCNRLAGSRTGDFATQIVSIIYGNDDYTVATGYNELNARVFADIYGASGPSTFSTSTLTGANTAGRGWRWADGAGTRVELIENTGLGHNWPSGSGLRSGTFVNGNSIDYPEALYAFIAANARRGSTGPVTPPPTGTDAGTSPTSDAGTSPTTDAGTAMGVTATLTEHINAGRLTWAEYGTYYLEYGTAPFTLYEQPDGSWSDTPPPGTVVPDAGVADLGTPADAGTPDLGPLDTGATPDLGTTDLGTPDLGAPDLGTPDSGPSFSCTSYTSSNYAHVTAGRGVICQSWYVCAVGSGDRLGLNNVFTQSTVAETAPGYYELGACP